MILLSAQPDEIYFRWQLEIQLTNFKELGLKSENIHVLFGFDQETGPDVELLEFAKCFKEFASVFFYPDTRQHKRYPSSIRPNIIKQHFVKFRYLEDEFIFYHDSDIIFTDKLPDFKLLCSDDIWYFSNTRSYIDTKYIHSKGPNILKEMCSIVNIPVRVVEDNDINAGGAQALLKNVNSAFWSKIERDSENLYQLLFDNTVRYRKDFLNSNLLNTSSYVPISSWCADMWALLWNSFLQAKVRIHKELDFCWPNQRLSLWNETNIFHNAGVNHLQKAKFFYKGDFIKSDPFEVDFSFISSDLCSSKYINYFKKLIRKKNANDSSVVIIFHAENNLTNIEIVISYLLKYFDIHILCIEVGERRLPNFDTIKLIDYVNIEKNNIANKINHVISIKCKQIIILHDVNSFFSQHDLYRSILLIRHKKFDLYLFNCFEFFLIKGNIKKFFFKKLDITLFSKFISSKVKKPTCYDTCIVIDKVAFLTIGGYNKYCYGKIYKHKELIARSQILGKSIFVKSCRQFIFSVDTNQSIENEFDQLKEYIKITKSDKMQLEKLSTCKIQTIIPQSISS